MKLISGDALSALKFISVSIVAGLIGLVFVPMLTRSLAPSDFASFSKSLLYAQMLASPSLFGISAYMTTLVEKIETASEEMPKAVSDWLLLLGGLMIVMLVGGIFVGPIFDVVMLILIAYARSWHALGAQSYRLLKSSKWFAIYQIGIPVTFFSTAIIGYQMFEFSGERLFYFSSIVYLVTVYHVWTQFKKRGWVDNSATTRFRDPRFLKFASGAFMHSLAGVAVTSWDKAYTSSVLDVHEFSLYIVGAQYAAGLVLIFTSISQAVVPQIYSSLSKEQGKTAACARLFMIMSLVFVLLFALFEAAIGGLMRFSLPVEFHAAIPIAQALGVAALLQGLYFLSSSVLFYYHRTFSLAIITMVCGALGALISAVSGALDSSSVVRIAILVWSVFFALTTLYSISLVTKNA